MYDGEPFTRIILRKMPPNMTEDKFKCIPLIQEGIKNYKLNIDFYTTDDIGETSAPNTSIAIIGAGNLPVDYVKQLAELKMELPFGGYAKPQIGFAPILMNIKSKDVKPRNLPSIDNDKEFIEFSKNYKEKMEIPTDAMISVQNLPKNPLNDNSELLKQFNISLLGYEGSKKAKKAKTNRK